MRPIYIECDRCEATYHVKHDMSEDHYQVTYCTFCGDGLDDYYDPNQRELEFEDEEDYIDW